VDPAALCRVLTVAQQQEMEIAKALATDARILVLDEPSATLTPPEVGRLFAVLRDLKARGLGIIYIGPPGITTNVTEVLEPGHHGYQFVGYIATVTVSGSITIDCHKPGAGGPVHKPGTGIFPEFEKKPKKGKIKIE